jgi:cytochrome c553
MNKMKKCLALITLWMLLVPSLSMAQVTYQKNIRSIMEARCSMCHGSQAPLIDDFKKDKDKYVRQNKGPRMDSYSLLIEFVKGKDAGAIMRRLDDGKSKDDKKPGNMYIFLGKDEEERQKNLKVFKEWVGSWNLKRKADLTPEETKKVTAPQ